MNTSSSTHSSSRVTPRSAQTKKDTMSASGRATATHATTGRPSTRVAAQKTTPHKGDRHH